ncbi:MAG: hypothetical protein JSS30_05120 [Verrucomicrobia bacterium]|nr:hypothetical protein [Verrucomicrobiota bacterium]
MKTTDKEKMCLSCEGRIPLNADKCSYCGAEQKNAYRAPIFQNQSLEDSLASLYTPPYQGKRPQFTKPQESQQDLLHNTQPLYKEIPENPTMDPLISADAQEEAPTKSSLWPTVLLFAGANFLFLGLMQLFFSKNGVLHLEWDAHYWFLYCIVAAPCLFFGYKKFKQL